MRKVMILTPCLTGSLDAYYVASLVHTLSVARMRKDLDISTMFIPHNSLIQTARNDLLRLAREADVDDAVWIDADIIWRPEWFFMLLDYPVDVVGGTYRRKCEEESYVCKGSPDMQRDHLGLLQVEGLGCGFLRFSRRAIDWLWDNSRPYLDGGKEQRWIFDVTLDDENTLVSEDISVCNKLRAGGFTIHCDPTMVCKHVGTRHYEGNFVKWLAELNRKRLAKVGA